jgi:predicted acyltransferase
MNAPKPSGRLLSLDTLRGFDMFWISGGEDLIHVLAKATGWSWAIALGIQFRHVEWHGFVAYDLIFPLFLFLAGVSTPFSVGSRLEKGADRTDLLKKAVSRGLILFFLGVIYNNGIFQTAWEEMRYGSVLGRIGLAGMFAQIIYIYCGSKAQWGWFFGLLIGYWLFMAFYPVPGCGAGLFTMECNPASYWDTILMPGRLYQVIHDPEGFVSTIPAISTALLGIFAGNILRDKNRNKMQKAGFLSAGGIICLVAALTWGTFFPINKNLWTSSFVFMTGGWSLLLLALFYFIVDIIEWRKWTFFFIVIGMNSIVIYMIGDFVDFGYTANALFGGILSFLPEGGEKFGKVVAILGIQWAFLYVLYRNKWFLKV